MVAIAQVSSVNEIVVVIVVVGGRCDDGRWRLYCESGQMVGRMGQRGRRGGRYCLVHLLQLQVACAVRVGYFGGGGRFGCGDGGGGVVVGGGQSQVGEIGGRAQALPKRKLAFQLFERQLEKIEFHLEKDFMMQHVIG